MSIPPTVRDEIIDLIWEQADDMDWIHLNNRQRSDQYKIWAQDERIGIVMSRYIPYQSVHKYIKDSIIKVYAKSKKLSETDILHLLNIEGAKIEEEYIKPMGVRLSDGRVICWGRAVDWKMVLLPVFERSTPKSTYIRHAVVLSASSGKFASPSWQQMVLEAGKLLKIERTIFLP
jgi:hypothetical protein